MTLGHNVSKVILSITHSYCSSVSVTCRHEILNEQSIAGAHVCYNLTYRIRTIEILQLKLMTYIYPKQRRYSVCQEHATPSNIKVLACVSFAALRVMFKYLKGKSGSVDHSFFFSSPIFHKILSFYLEIKSFLFFK